MRTIDWFLLCALLVVACGKAHTKPPPEDPPWPEEVERDDDCDGVVDACEMFVETDDGVRSGVDLNCDGTLDEACVLQRVQDNVVMTHLPDDDCDGTPDGTRCFRTDDNLDGHSLFRLDDGCDGVWERCVDSGPRRGDRASSTVDDGCDGTLDRCVTVTHSAGNQKRTETDEGCDGTVEEVTCRVQEPPVDDGNARSATDDDCDGTPDTFCSEKTYMHGVEVAEQRDNECDGIPEVCRSAIIHGSDVLTSGFDGDCDGTPESGCFGFRFRDGQLAGQFDDLECDGVPDGRCWVIDYDSSGLWLGRSFDTDCDGNPDWCESAIY